jgi:hypothetical protein
MGYNGALTAEQFLFFETRICAKRLVAGAASDAIVRDVCTGNLFQYPTERELPRIARTCIKRLEALGQQTLVFELAEAPVDAAKQINLYAMMRHYRIVWEFMTEVVGEKYRTQDFGYSKRDVNLFLTRLRAENDDVAQWSEKTFVKIGQVLAKCLIEAGFVDGVRAATLNPVFLCAELEGGIRGNEDFDALPAFNCFLRCV